MTMRASIGSLLARVPPGIAVVLAAVIVLVIGVIDHTTGLYLGLSFFYIGPIAMAAWYGGRLPAICVAGLASLTGMIADLAPGSGLGFLPFWNAIVRLGVFLVIGGVVAALRTSLETQRRLAHSDPLTGAANARSFDETAEKELARARRYGHPIALAYLDLDNFKQVNDGFGHRTGDRVLQIVAETIQGQVRPSDLLARMGGDEFAILMPQTNAEQACRAFERIRGALESRIAASGWPVTLSVGITEWSEEVDSIDRLFSRADSLMYQAKRDGKNSIVREPSPTVVDLEATHPRGARLEP
jgi:diguanylate cyclase (GGDEF)-like protein